MKFGSIMRACRERAGFSQEELAHRLHTDPSNISRMENGKQSIFLETAMDWVRETKSPEVMVAWMFGADGARMIEQIKGA